MATAFSQFGDRAGPIAVLSKPIGGTASAGDWLTVTTAGIEGDGLNLPVVTDNISGSTGWELLADFTSSEGGDSFRTATWRKLCVGGETDVTATWAAVSQVAMIGAWLSALTQPGLYVLDQGQTTWDGSFSSFTSANAPVTNAESYYGVLCNGRGDLTFGDLRPAETSALFEPLNGYVHALALYNNDEGTNTVADSVRVRVTPNRVCYVVLLAIGPSAVDLEGAGGLALGGTGALTTTGGGIDLAGTGGLALGGAGVLTQTGGDTGLAGAGGLALGGSGRLISPRPFPTPVRPAEDHLGCGVYQAFAFTRGLQEIVTMLPFTSLEWARILDDTSTASVTIDGVANPRALARCCEALSELEPSEHELALYRNGWRVWSGPMTDLSFPAEQCVIQASDLSWWLSQRSIHANINSVGIDLANILVAYVDDAMSVDNSAGLIVQVLALAGMLGDRLVQQKDHQTASDAIAELARTGVDWTQLDRRMLVGPLQPQPAPFPGATPYPTLIDSNFRIQPTILVSGSQGANAWYVNGPPNGAGDLIFGEYGPHFPATPDHVEVPAAPDYAAIEAQYGRIEKVVTESRVLDQPGIDANARTRYDLLKRPLVYISEGALLPSTPIPIEKLLPGSLVNVHLSNVCRIIAEPYRIKQVHAIASSDGSEQVDVQWQPLGTGGTL